MSDQNRPFGYLQLWDAVAAEVGDRECIVQGEHRLTWADVHHRTTRLGWLLTNHGLGPREGADNGWVSPNDTVGLLLRNRPEYLETCLASYRARCAPFNINYRYQAEEIAYLLADARPSALIYQPEFAGVLADALALTPEVAPLLIHVDDDSGVNPLAGSLSYERSVLDATEPSVRVEPSPDDVHILYTGGTTGMPKGVIWRLRELAGRPCGITIGSLEEAAAGAPRRAWLRAHPAAPLMHGAAAWFTYGAWARGGTIVLSEDQAFDAAATLDLCSREQVAWMAIVGDAFAQPILEALRAGEVVPDKLSYVFSSGARLSPESWSELETYFPDLVLVNALGSSETGPQALQTSSQQSQFRAGPSTYVVADEYGALLTAANPGVGWLASAGELPRGYLNDEQRTAATFRVVDGIRLSVSGDRAEIDGKGEIKFLGRESGVINTGGEKVYAEEVELAVRALPQVADVVVIGRPSDRWGAEVVALVVPMDDEVPSRDSIRAGCAGRIAGYKLPRVVVPVASIRRLENGKVDYAWALDQALAASS